MKEEICTIILDLNNHYITIPDFSGDIFYTFEVSIYNGTYYSFEILMEINQN